MKKFLFFFLTIFILAPLSFGGRVITAPTPGVSCPVGGLVSPYTITPAGVFPPALYITTPWVGGFGAIAPGAYILGLYNPIPIPECATTTVPPVPAGGFRTILYGTNLGL